jgi:hypothetical protein
MKTLCDLAVKASYKAIIAEFDSIFQYKNYSNSSDDEETEREGQPPTKKRTKVEKKTHSVKEYLLNPNKREEALKELKKKLDQYLIGPFSVERPQFVDRYIKSFSNRKPSEIYPILILAFFNCLLDGDITYFNLTGGKGYHPFQGVIDPLKLLPIISQRCTNLQSLSLSFGVHRSLKVPLVPSLCDTLRGFKRLTSLTLLWYPSEDTDFLPFLTALGDAC